MGKKAGRTEGHIRYAYCRPDPICTVRASQQESGRQLSLNSVRACGVALELV